ncbi:MAG TPA: UDP-N-acetylmuramate dehydrogenase [Anaerolineae bacterium]|nr:UDP-N-acetylmuramate dehydrogenase [Anaerolineae bacterium]
MRTSLHRRDELLARHTTLRIGGPADYFVIVHSRDELIQAVQWAQAQHLNHFVLGNGSNILVSDAGIRGVVIENHADKVLEYEIQAKCAKGRRYENRERVVAESGASLPGLANRLSRKGWSGLEWAIGVPATVGAAVVTNAGAHGGSISDSLVRAEIFDTTNSIEWWTCDRLQYDYRHSNLKGRSNEFVVLRAELELQRDDPAACIARMNQYTEHRRRTQPTEPSVGSMFKNPPNDYAGRLIEAAGLKGKRIGQVQVSSVHANFFVNLGGATAKQVMELVALVRTTVREKFNVNLELEIELIGEGLTADC